MSIEELFKAVIVALEANTKAVNALEASLQGRTPSKSAEKPKAEAKEEKAPKDVKKEDPKVEESDTVSGAGESADTEVKATSYETLRELVLRLASGGKREGIKAVSAKHGITAPKDLLKDANDYSSVTDQEKLEAVYADLLALEA